SGSSTTGGKKSSVKMSARSSSNRYTAASSAGASPTRRFSASAGTKPASNCSRRAAEYFAAQPPHEARSVSLTRPVSMSKRALPRVEPRNVGVCEPFVYRLPSVHLCYDVVTGSIPACQGGKDHGGTRRFPRG